MSKRSIVMVVLTLCSLGVIGFLLYPNMVHRKTGAVPEPGSLEKGAIIVLPGHQSSVKVQNQHPVRGEDGTELMQGETCWPGENAEAEVLGEYSEGYLLVIRTPGGGPYYCPAGVAFALEEDDAERAAEYTKEHVAEEAEERERQEEERKRDLEVGEMLKDYERQNR